MGGGGKSKQLHFLTVNSVIKQMIAAKQFEIANDNDNNNG